MKQLKKYIKIVHEIYDYFDYTSGEKIYPIEDYTKYEWNKYNNKLFYWIDDDDDPIYDDIVEEYKGDEYTMFLIRDTLNLDDCLVIFDNKKYLAEDDYRDQWKNIEIQLKLDNETIKKKYQI